MHPHEDHHTQQQEDDVQVDGAHGVFKGEDEKGLVKGAEGIGDEQDEGRAQQGRQGAVHPFERDDDVNQQQDQGGEPEGRGDGPFQFKVLGGLEEFVAGGISARLHNLDGRGRQGLPGRFGGLDLHFGPGQGPGRQEEFAHEAPRTCRRVISSSFPDGLTGWPFTSTSTSTSLTPLPWGFCSIPATVRRSPVLGASAARATVAARSPARNTRDSMIMGIFMFFSMCSSPWSIECNGIVLVGAGLPRPYGI